ncbi:SusD/RagB family nutrient-binding outer membrane lipoprotein [Tenacibaculum maritimum]|uniref:SusD/RagB family nutrient-binding outer membrane lipoprotein n=1 Tax=Tenacibaculum maritimum TaxID=107401 RepID=UPI0010A490F9|nr:SusD/RagB family nutrient-binding outer membrane lipoprotein [Tenacibaculum maritimum]QCD63215.1 SusD/RagB family nutrient-binding outer membrane lipoprotein [Tenacibaculum maritimum]CAA0146828.1 SusD/RagB family lipoprotein precursor [Tenacibaculum maritimum]CAA0148373.1 SusD/RagB family lipoprotein precursor [Tenacibaculum maritimum]CAA0148549.1 SusD/RagB family lipoprotein precursor [Tenacibaculum maritimum]CAA0163461.1 SusD/RagB family lipoprotein precursor [Tenacibaculum maritimum]
MKNNNNYILFLVLILLSSCTKDFQEINTNTNNPVNVQPSFLLRQVIYNFGENMSYEGFVAGDLLAQHRTALDFNLFDRHALKSPQLGGNPWAIFYKNLRDNEIILKQANTSTANLVYKGPALILKAYMAMGLTDLFGDVPYFDAFKGTEGVVTPTYDQQQRIYLDPNGILDNLDNAITALKNYKGITPLEGDILYRGNLQSWIQFANSLKIKALIRISSKVNVKNDLQKLYNEGNYIKVNTQNAVFDFTNTAPNSFRLAQLRVGDFNNFVLSETMEEIMNRFNDTRLATLFRPYANATSNEFNGLINGIDASNTSIALADYSLAGTIFREDTATLDANFLTAWETSLLLAEAAEKGLIIADAKKLYETGVTLAFEYWNTELPANYLNENASYNAIGTTPLEQIATQKWISSVINGYESWIEYRRTGFPNLKPIAASLNNNLIPIRMPYPPEEEALNKKNYTIAAQATNNNSINVPVWWDN